MSQSFHECSRYPYNNRRIKLHTFRFLDVARFSLEISDNPCNPKVIAIPFALLLKMEFDPKCPMLVQLGSKSVFFPKNMIRLVPFHISCGLGAIDLLKSLTRLLSSGSNSTPTTSSRESRR